MPRNQVLERMAKKLSKHIADSFCSKKEWEETSANYKTTCYSVALESLGIVESRTYGSENGNGEVIVACEDDLVKALQLAREAREEKEKNGG